MAYFLSQQRRNALIQCLTDLSMPLPAARDCASYSDDLRRLDKYLANIVGHLCQMCGELRRAALDRNEDQRRKYEASLRADLLIFRAYTSEVNAQKLPALMLPKTTEAVGAGIESIDPTKGLILVAMDQGRVH
jgi:hypothetical protein